jgi:hypothetical protein
MLFKGTTNLKAGSAECLSECAPHLSQPLHEAVTEEDRPMAVGFKVDPDVKLLGGMVQVLDTSGHHHQIALQLLPVCRHWMIGSCSAPTLVHCG